jgi:uncharacterized protein (DUF1697 family)
MHTYVALLRGINVGGHRKVPMTELRKILEALDFRNVRTLIASGNVVFNSDLASPSEVLKKVEVAIEKGFGFRVDVLLLNKAQMAKLVSAIPDDWVSDKQTKCDVMFLWPVIDNAKILSQLPFTTGLEEVKYAPGAIIWRLSRDKISMSRISKITGTSIYKQMTVRNTNTVRKIYHLMIEAESSN